MEAIINRLMEISKTIASLYQKLFSEDEPEEMEDKITQNLNFALAIERKIYQSIPTDQYSQYIQVLTLEDSANENMLSIMLENYYFEPRIRVINQFFYLQQKSAMYNEGVKENIYSDQMIQDLRFAYLYHYELFLNLSRYYQLFIESKENLTNKLIPSYYNVIYSFPYVEDFYHNKDILKVYDKKSLQYFSTIKNIETKMEKKYENDIVSLYEEIMKQNEGELFTIEKETIKALLTILLSSYYLSIDNTAQVVHLFNTYRAKNYPDLSLHHQEFLEEFASFTLKTFSLRRKFKHHDEEISLKQI